MQASDRNGAVVGAVQVTDSDEIMLISNQGTAVRTRIEEVGVQGRNTQGVRVIRTRDGEVLVSVSRITEDDIETPDIAAPPVADAPVSGAADSEEEEGAAE